MRKDRQATRLGQFIIGRMAEINMTRQVDLVRASNLSDSTVSRLIYNEGYRPDNSTIADLARGLAVDFDELLRFVVAGSGQPTPTSTGEYRHLIESVRQLLDEEDSPLEPADRQTLATLIRSVIEPFARTARRKTNRAS